MTEPTRSRKLICLLSIAAAFLAAGQAPNDEVRVSSRTYVPGMPPSDPNLVQIAVVVRDSKGQTVPGLKAENFQVLDQGKALAISGVLPVTRTASASPPPARPQHFAICFDDYLSTPGTLQRAKSIASRFVQEGMAAGDLGAVASTFNNQMQEFTPDKSKVQGAIERVKQEQTPSVSTPTRVKTGANPGAGVGGTAAAPGADASFGQEITARSFLDVISGFEGRMAGMAGSRTIVMFSPGFSGMPEREQDQVIDRAVRAGIVINVLDTKGSYIEVPASSSASLQLPATTYSTDPGSLGVESAMAEFAHSTGGLFFHRDGDPFSRGFRELGAVPEFSYLLAVRPDNSDTKYHKLKVQMASAASSGPYAIEARSGYFPLPKGAVTETAETETARAKLDRQVTSMQPVTDFPSSVGVQYDKLPNGNTAIRVLLHVDIKSLQFTKQNDRRKQRLTMVAAILDDSGRLIAAKEGLMDFAVTEAKYNSLLASGLSLTLNLEAAPGIYRLSTVAQESQGKLASTLNAIQVP
jgi:VWFA-related protein